MPYDYANLQADIETLKNSGAKIFYIGKTVLGKQIPCVFKGNLDGAQVFVHGAIHAREYITSPLLIELIKNYNGAGGIWCVPMVNIDGVELCQHGLASVPQEKHEFLLKANDGSENFELWKANINAVDLNTNFFAKWGEGANNVTYPNPSDYIGKMPACEPETQALINITQKILPSVTLSYHTRGEMVYWGFETVKTYLNEAREISMLLDYPLKESTGSAGGYKDWFVACTYNLGLTVECINENTDYPIPLDVLPQLYRRHKDVLYLSEDIARRIAK